mgnify:CR=1 FL=1
MSPGTVGRGPARVDAVLAEYERWGPELGGVRGSPLNPQRPSELVVLWRRIFGMGGWWPEASGRVTFSADASEENTRSTKNSAKPCS